MRNSHHPNMRLQCALPEAIEQSVYVCFIDIKRPGFIRPTATFVICSLKYSLEHADRYLLIHCKKKKSVALSPQANYTD
jgi:hypothetical protein